MQELTETRGTDGSVVKSWSDMTPEWASKRDIRGREVIAGNSGVSEGTVIFGTRWHEGITTKGNRISYGGDIYDIINIAEYGRRDGLELTCKVRNVV